MDNIIVHKEFNKTNLLQKYDILSDKISVIPHGVKDLEADAKVSKVNKALLFGFLRGRKKPRYVMKLAKDFPEIEFILAGRGNIRSDELDNVTVMNEWISEEEKEDLFVEADLILLPYSKLPSASGVMADAIAFETPVLASDIPNFKFVEENEIGNTKGLKNLSEGLEEIQKNYKQYLKNMRAYKKKIIWKKIAKKHMNVYNKNGHTSNPKISEILIEDLLGM